MSSVAKAHWWNHVNPLWLLSIPSAAAVVTAAALMVWPIHMLIHIELTTNRLQVTLDKSHPQRSPVLDHLNLRSVGIQGFSDLTLEAEKLQVADPAAYDIATDSFPATAWKSVSVPAGEILITKKESTSISRATIEGVDDGVLHDIHVGAFDDSPGEQFIIEKRGGTTPGLAVTLPGERTVDISPNGAFFVIANQVRLDTVPEVKSSEPREINLRVELRQDSPFIVARSGNRGMVILPTFRPSSVAYPISSNVAILSIDLTRQGPAGERVSALSAKGTVSFPDRAFMTGLSVDESQVLEIEGLRDFLLTEIVLLPNSSGIKLIGEGLAWRIRMNHGDVPTERHLSALDSLTHNARLAGLFALLAWIIPTMLGAKRLYTDFSSKAN